MRRLIRIALIAVASVACLVAALVVLDRTGLLQFNTESGFSMAPTLPPCGGGRVIAEGFTYRFRDPRRGEIVVFHAPKTLPCSVVGRRDGDLMGRVVAVPGQQIWSAGNAIVVDGRPLHEGGWYDARYGEVGSKPIPHTTLAADQYFVLSDNRADTCDSRVFGPISKASVVGEGIAIVGRNGHASFGTL